uniref:Uncharacterized protein n=1 Tax=Ralstonia solanacearum TaxID=305 RepID=A0A0S4TPS8_RALSL|nr:protein of unknown function [Ralstonia solanacearum]
MKMDGKLDRNRLKGALGDAMHAVLCDAGHNLQQDPPEAAASLRPCSGCPVQALRPSYVDSLRHSSGENELFRTD